MISVAEATRRILAHVPPSRLESVALIEAEGRVLAEPLHADRDFPPFDRVTMDGIAFRAAAWEAGQRRFPILDVQAAGMPQRTLHQPDACMEVMTGAVLPLGTDTVVRYEDLLLEEGHAIVSENATVALRQNIHAQGSDRRAGDLIVKPGRRIGAAEIAAAATVGKSRLLVQSLPRVAVVSTGDELVPVAATPLPHQIRTSNSLALAALLRAEFGISCTLHHFPDDVAHIKAGLQEILQSSDVVVLSGAVSEGKFDHLPRVLADLGVEKVFHKVAQRPGKPFWFGHAPGPTAVFALPGNPVSAFLCACRYLRPFLGGSIHAHYAVLAAPVVFKPALTYFLPVRLESRPDGYTYAHPLPGHGSGDLANLTDADAFLELPAEREVFEIGEVVNFCRF